jgi:uncharacterized protein (DUF433 family)
VSSPIQTEHPHIVRVPGVAGGRPVIKGTRITVVHIAQRFRAGEEPWEIIATYPDIAPAAVYDAISYYLDHRDEINRWIEDNAREKLAERLSFEVDTSGRVVFTAP